METLHLEDAMKLHIQLIVLIIERSKGSKYPTRESELVSHLNIDNSEILHGPSMLPDKAKFVVCSIISLALSFWMKHLVIGQLQKPAKFSAFHQWSHLEVRLLLVSFWEPAG